MKITNHVEMVGSVAMPVATPTIFLYADTPIYRGRGLYMGCLVLGKYTPRFGNLFGLIAFLEKIFWKFFGNLFGHNLLCCESIKKLFLIDVPKFVLVASTSMYNKN